MNINETYIFQSDSPLISVIIPVYNVELYLDRAVKSILSQTYQNLEIILVDDGSTDKSPQMCDKYKMCDRRVRVVHKENGGLSSARNAGLDIARGKYISFLDSDDWVANDLFEYCLSLIESKPVDIVQYATVITSVVGQSVTNQEKIRILRGKDILDYLMIQSTKSDRYYAAWNCLYTRDIIGELRFPVGRINEDIVWKYQVLSKANMMIDSTIVKHYYYRNDGSITKSGLKKRDFDLMIAGEEIKKLSSCETYGRIRQMGAVKCARSSLSLLCKIAYYGISDEQLKKKEIVKELTKRLRKDYFVLIVAPMAFSRKILATLFCINYKMTELIVFFVKCFQRSSWL
ncbi:glycosyltransferase family 2 protein [Massilimicrobiota sp. An105]|uniref:glycosyltransferase family 2 protein n=1 Tax=Massilimicrobiota sp. An105 TaxID=1965540 RepID=UPI001302E1D9|nr:glycosyltransferase family 2 protein [Massilimicrobiota sp. An105]